MCPQPDNFLFETPAYDSPLKATDFGLSIKHWPDEPKLTARSGGCRRGSFAAACCADVGNTQCVCFVLHCNSHPCQLFAAPCGCLLGTRLLLLLLLADCLLILCLHPIMIHCLNTSGTPAYMAPELVLQSYDEKCDLWSVGMLTYQLCTGRFPFWEDVRHEPLGEVWKAILTQSINWNAAVSACSVYSSITA